MALTITVFAVATAVVGIVGPRLARVAEAIANRLDVGHVLVGAVLLGVVTSLPGLVFTVVAAAGGDAELAVSNALGGVVAQTLFLAIADLVFRHGTLSSRVPTRQVGFQAALLVVLLALVVIGLGSPSAQLWRVHPISAAIVAAYLGGLFLSRRLDVDAPDPRRPSDPADRSGGGAVDPSDTEGGRGGLRGKLGTLEASPDVEREARRPWPAVWARFAAFAGALGAAGFALAWSGGEIAESTALSASSVGVLLTAVATSTPELVTAVAAARRGAIGLAAGDIIGGNTFDTLFVAAADLASPEAIFAGAGSTAIGLTGLALLLNGVLLAGLVRRGSGARDVDAESYAIVAIWFVGVLVILL